MSLDMKKEFDHLNVIASQTMLDLLQIVPQLKKNQVIRVFLAVLEYPGTPENPLIGKQEVEVYKLATGLKEMQMKQGMLNLAMQEQERQELQKETINEENTSI